MYAKRIKRLVLLRLLFAVLLLYAPTLFRPEIGPYFYTSSLLIGFLSAVYVVWYLVWRHYLWLAIFQIAADVLLETYLVWVAGGAESLFAILYVLTILSAAFVLGEKRLVMGMTFLSCITYLSASTLEYFSPTSQFTPRDPLYLFYAVLIRLVIFAAVGNLSRYFSTTVLELEKRLQLSERLSLLGEVISKISHEIRNPLASVQTAAEVLNDSLAGKLDAQQSRMLEIVKVESQRLTQTLQRILSYTRQVKPSAQSLLLNDVIERVLGMARLNLGVHFERVTVEKNYDATKTHLYADEEQVVGAFLNLTLNALQAMPEGGELKVKAAEDIHGTTVDFEDTGGGIPEEKLKDLFTPFKSTKKGGTGLGLAEVHKIVTLHEGNISVQSKKGKGTVFHLFFPKP